MKIVTKDGKNRKTTYTVREMRRPAMTSRDSIRKSYLSHRPVMRPAMLKKDAEEEKLSPKAVKLLNGLVEKGITIDDIVKAVKPEEDKEEELDIDEEIDLDEIPEDIEEESEDEDFGEEKVKDFGDSKKKNSMKSVGSLLKKTTSNDSTTSDIDSAWANRMNKKGE